MATISDTYSDITLEAVKTWVYSEATQAHERQIGELEKANKELGAFQSKLDVRVKELQDERIPKPDQSVLFNEVVNWVVTYDRLHIEALKTQKLAGELQSSIDYLTPREIVGQAIMKKRGGDLWEASHKVDVACEGYINSLKDCQATVDALQRKMFEQISFKTTPAIQKLGAIFENIKKAPNSWTETITSWFVSGEDKPVIFTQVGDGLDDFRTEASLLNVASVEVTFGKHSFIDITLEVLKQEAFNIVTRAYVNQIGNIEKANERLGGFERGVAAESSPLQHGNVRIPNRENLYRKRVEFIKDYDGLYREAGKAQKFAGELQYFVEFLQRRIIINEATMKAHGGQLAKVSELTDATYSKYLTTLIGYQAKVDTLQQQMVQQILGSAASSLQRFCQIVDNDGKPLDHLTRLINRTTWAVVPELTEAEAKLDEEMNKFSTSTPSFPALNSEETASPMVSYVLPAASTVSEKQEQATSASESQVLSDGYDTGSAEAVAALMAEAFKPMQLFISSDQGGVLSPNGQINLFPVL